MKQKQNFIKNGKLFVIAAPITSGTGKTTLIKETIKRLKEE